ASAQNHFPSSWTCIWVFRRIGEVMPPEGVQSQLQCLGSGFWADGLYLDDGIEDIPSLDARHIVHHDKYVKPGRPPEMGFWGRQRQRLCPLNGLNHIFPQANPAKHFRPDPIPTGSLVQLANQIFAVRTQGCRAIAEAQ